MELRSTRLAEHGERCRICAAKLPTGLPLPGHSENGSMRSRGRWLGRGWSAGTGTTRQELPLVERQWLAGRATARCGPFKPTSVRVDSEYVGVFDEKPGARNDTLGAVRPGLVHVGPELALACGPARPFPRRGCWDSRGRAHRVRVSPIRPHLCRHDVAEAGRARGTWWRERRHSRFSQGPVDSGAEPPIQNDAAVSAEDVGSQRLLCSSPCPGRIGCGRDPGTIGWPV